jgi:hypothetical protein
MGSTHARYDGFPYQPSTLALRLFALAALAIDTLLTMDRDVRAILEYADLAVCGIFLFDFVRSPAVTITIPEVATRSIDPIGSVDAAA